MSTTPNYGMQLFTDDDDMYDAVGAVVPMDANWALIEAIPRPESGSSLPTDTTGRNPGDRFYHTGLKSMFVLVSVDTFWGCVWRPIQIKYGPWTNVPALVLADATNYAFSNFDYRMSNRGRIFFRGAITPTSGGFVDYEATGTQLVLLNPLPPELRPNKNKVFTLPLYDIQFTEIVMGRLSIVGADGTMSQVTWNKTASSAVNMLGFDGVSWVIGSNTGYGPNL